ncbi:GDSL-type esterase/lipase family protein [Sinomicrobium weinanense]|uniref:G-D-S-L family lipolytic protein n=1 Tax=Sinomicrobium weinanense TaxID=2842200 RepID=A0A926JTT0_9FLAO|nr:GDSL-type esterase/lipase family protein [Sinomicrobium weinanense]MBC9797112.1 G-D-S-L family lipolytic protein [Sinomicrobium weinanense]MBU3124808.1 G-D-S-L family lipolytic protein [Sinomicrobium weinanense]
MKKIVVLLLFFGLNTFSYSQDADRFKGDIASFRQESDTLDLRDYDALIVGSSSVRMWQDIDRYFPGHKFLNRGFGGSQMSDVIYYMEDLIFRHPLEKLFLYEGDNDIAWGKSVGRVKRDFKKVLREVRKRMPDTQVYIISVKPALQKERVERQRKYLRLNRWMNRYCNRKEQLRFVDVWPAMLSENGVPREELFIEDGLHMTGEGYKIWANKITPFLR